MPEVMRQRASILALVGELVSRRMPQHMRMNWEWELSGSARSLDHPQEPRCCNRSASLGDEHIRTVALKWSQRSQFRAMQRMNTLNSTLSSVSHAIGHF